MKLIIIDYGSGNLKSVGNAFKNSILENDLNFSVEVTSDLKSIKNSDLSGTTWCWFFPRL